MKRRKPIIGIPANLMVDNNGSFPGSRRVIVNQDYLLSVQAAGGQPIILPYTAGVEDIPAQLALVDGMLFTGGADMDPLVYEEQPIPGLEDVYREVDDHQVALCLAGWRQGLPMFGICRGMQVLNVALGGTLHQDLQSLPIPILGHVQKGLRYAVSHLVDTEEGSRLRALFTQATIGTNSFHHQAIKDLAPGFRVSARARDGVIEGNRMHGRPASVRRPVASRRYGRQDSRDAQFVSGTGQRLRSQKGREERGSFRG